MREHRERDHEQADIHEDRFGSGRCHRPGGPSRTGRAGNGFGVVLDDVGRSQTRLLGAAYIGYAAIVWMSRDVRDLTAQRAIALGNLLSWALSLIVAVAGLAAGLAGAQSWALVALELAFTAAWGYFAFMDRAEVRAG
jgi:hypothetical protein